MCWAVSCPLSLSLSQTPPPPPLSSLTAPSAVCEMFAAPEAAEVGREREREGAGPARLDGARPGVGRDKSEGRPRPRPHPYPPQRGTGGGGGGGGRRREWGVSLPGSALLPMIEAQTCALAPRSCKSLQVLPSVLSPLFSLPSSLSALPSQSLPALSLSRSLPLSPLPCCLVLECTLLPR